MYDFAMTFRFLAMVLPVGAALCCGAQVIPPRDVPDKIKAPAGESVVLVAHASGVQTYVCQAGTDGKLGWTLKAPEAELRNDQGAVIGRHYAGPSWKLNDGSEVTGKPIARIDSPDPASIPWLLGTAVGHSGEGTLTRVTTIQRLNTKGGNPPSADTCDSAKQGSESKSSYTADYYFYAPAK
jgi:hypothetical protein